MALFLSVPLYVAFAPNPTTPTAPTDRVGHGHHKHDDDDDGGGYAPPGPPPSLESLCGWEDGVEVQAQCKLSWTDAQPHMRPTQPGIGYHYAMRKLVKDMGAYKTLKDAQKDAQETMDDKGIPVVKYGAKFFFTDGHHTQSALDALHGVHPGIDVNITITIICDMSSYAEADFWATMASRGWAYLWNRPDDAPNALPTPFDPSDLPATISWRSAEKATLSNDVWRSWAGYVRKVEEDYITKWWPAGVDCAANAAGAFDAATMYEFPYTGSCAAPDPDDEKCMRAFDRHCDAATCTTIPFFEYYWGYFMNDKYNSKDSLLTTFSTIYEKPLVEPSDSEPYTMPTEQTIAAANLPDILPWTFCDSATGADPDEESAKCHSAKDGYKQWILVAAELIPVTRVGGAGEYRLPTGFLKADSFTPPQTLPGVVPGYTPIYYSDADCVTAGSVC